MSQVVKLKRGLAASRTGITPVLGEVIYTTDSRLLYVGDGSTLGGVLLGGSVTNVSALSIGTSGSDINSSVLNGTTTPIITINIPTASASNRGALDPSDWNTFNNKQNTGLSLLLTGGSMSGLITFQTSSLSNGFRWDVNSDAAGITFKNTGDGDSNSYFNFFTEDNGNEYFKFSHNTWNLGSSDWMDIKDSIVRTNGNIYVNASQSGDKASGTNDLTGGNLVWHQGNLTNLNQLANGPGYLTSAAPVSGSGSYIQNQSSSAQSANLWISGSGKFDETEISHQGTYGRIQSYSGTPLSINPLGNNVGIGTTDPQTKLEVSGGHTTLESLTIKPNNKQYFTQSGSLQKTTLGYIAPSMFEHDYEGANVNFSIGWNGTIKFENGNDGHNNGKFLIPYGNVGIGTTAPQTKLEIKSSGTGNAGAVITLNRSGSWANANSGLKLNTNDIGTDYWNIGMRNNTTNNFTIGKNENSLFSIIENTGNTIIGLLTDNEVDKLQVDGTVSASNGTLIGGNGDINYVPKFSNYGTLSNSSISDNGAGYVNVSANLQAETLYSNGLTVSDGHIYLSALGQETADFVFNDGNDNVDISKGLAIAGKVSGLPATLPNEFVTKSQLDLKSNLASPPFTGIPTAPTASTGTNTTQLATTAFVQAADNTLQNQIALIPAEKYLKNTAFYVPIGFDFATISSISQQTIIITNAHNLLGNTINFGANRIVQFLGGTFTNGTLTGTNCQLIADRNTIFPSTDVSFGGTWINDIYPEWWATNTTTDWQPALQKALDKAKLSSGKVSLASYLYQYYNQLTVHEGTSIFGTSRGDTAFGAGPSKGSVLRCLGNSLGSTTNQNIAIKVVGRMITLKDFTLRGERSINKYGDGIVLYGIGDGSSSQALLENCYLGNLLIHGFQKGKGLCLVAGNSGSVTYSNFANIRIRDCAKHLSIEALSSNPIYGHLGSTGLPYSNINCFINSNTFTGLYLSGYCETGIHVYTEFDELLTNGQQVFRPANNLIFNGLVVEPPYSSNSHIRIEGAGSSIRVHDIRVEASAQDANYPAVPVVYLGTGTNANFIDCDQMSVTIQDFGWNNSIGGHNQKNGNATPNTTNLYKNSAFVGLNKTGVNVIMPEWSVEEQYIGVPSYAWRPLTVASAITLNYTTDVVEEGYKVISVTVPPNYQFRMSQNIDRTLHKIYNAKINAIVKATNLKDVIWTYQDSATPIISGGTVFGGSTFEPMGGFFPVTQTDISSYYRISVFCQNYTATPITFSITMPSFVTGQITPTLPAKLITENGGTFYGVTSHNVVKNIKPFTNPGIGSVSSSDIILPLEGNYFEIDEGGFSIAKINATVTRFGRGTVITLYFNYAGISIVKSAFLNIFKPFISEVGCTLTLQSPDGNGLWYELSRSERKIQGLYTGVAPMTGNILNLDTTCNVFNLNGFVSSISIIRINDSIKFNEGSQITLNFISPSGYVGISNSAYIALNNPVVYYPGDGDWIKLETTGNGTWYEIARKTKPQEPSYLGFSTVDASTAVVTNFLALPLIGEKYFSIINTSGATRTVTRINDILKFTGGSEIMLRFGTTALPITTANAIGLANSAYISLRYNTTYNPVTGDWIKLMTMGDGQWIETERKQVDVPFSTDGAATSNLATSVVTNFLTLVTTGENYFTITNTGASSTIQRINNASGTRLSAGKDITLVFGTLTNTVTLVNSGYITLMYGVNYSPIAGDWMTLRTIGDGTWKEIDRIPSATPEVTTANKDATGGYAGLTLFKINFKNALNTFTSFFTNANTAARTYTFQDRDGTIADNTDLLSKANIASPTFTGIPAAPTPVAGTNTTQLATTAFVQGTKKIVVRKISTAILLADTDNCTVILLTASCTVTLPNGLISGFNCSFATQTGATLTYSLGGSITLINNTGTTMGELSSHTLVNTGVTNEYLTVGL